MASDQPLQNKVDKGIGYFRVASDQPPQNKVDKGIGYCRVRHCVQSFLRLTEEWRLVTDAEGR